ncbi:alpha/beta hydrolase-fold protein [Chitinophaga horti]|uniref:Alpha/beta hydrolase-fold protein n=1 Tax=Chitinophaga horti TaxID=2920382 RepID=A0ABY6J182_9BACT|nr:alpha/beta hydrolase-fold protein [Chitinophaga horti]UYQ93411.1 alpha/beta hydrolase-fold protein [Chitinophaga horti]
MTLVKLLTAICLLLSLSATAQFKPAETIRIDSKYFHDQRDITVLLPQGYESAPGRTYKVVYLFDAQNSTFTNTLMAVGNYLSTFSSTFISPYIIVGIKTKNRQYEFLPENHTQQPYRDYFPKVKLGGADTLLAFLQKEVIPEVNKRFRTNHYNVAIGHSLGATFAIYSLMHAPQLFNAVIAISPNLYYDEEQLLKAWKHRWSTLSLNRKMLYVMYSQEGKLESRFFPANEKLRAFLAKNRKPGFHSKVEYLPDTDHGLTPLMGIPRGLMELNRQLVIDETVEGFYAKDDPQFLEKLKQFYAQQSEKTGLRLPTAEDINHIAYNLANSGKIAEAIRVAAWAVALYPQDANAFDTQGELLQRDKQPTAAKAAYQQGLQLVERQRDLLDTATHNSLKRGFERRLSAL